MTQKDLNSHDADPKERAAVIRQQNIDGLLDERRQNENRPDRVKAIDAELKDAGYEKPAKRQAPKSETA